MNTQTIIINRKNIVPNSNNTKFIYTFPKPINVKSQEIALASLTIYYSWPNIQIDYSNNIFQYMWWDHQGVLNQTISITIPDGYYSISTLSAFLQSQMFLKGHYLVNSSTLNKIYFISLIENPTYYACEINFTAMYAKGTSGFTNENGPTQVTVNGQQVWKGWDMPSARAYPKVVFSSSYKMTDFLGFKAGTYPASNIPVVNEYDMLGNGEAPNTYPVSAINIKCNMCKSEISIPNDVLYSFSQGSSPYGDIINVSPQNLIYLKVQDGTYSQIELTFVDQDFNPMKILDSQVNIIILLRDY